MAESTTLSSLITVLEERFSIVWVAGKNAGNRDIVSDMGWGSHPKVVGHMNLIHPNRVQVLGEIEMEHVNKLSADERKELLIKLFSGETFTVVIAHDIEAPADFIEYANNNKVALLSSHLPSNELVTKLRYRLTVLLADKQTLHGVFMEVISVGILITGESSVGKSELALELITRGHRLIADDAPEFARITPDIISGSCPALLQDLLEVRGLGILNIREMYGDGAIKHSKYLRLIIKLVPVEQNDHLNRNRLSSFSSSLNIMGVTVTEIGLPVAPGRNLAVLVEAAVRNYLVQVRGYNASDELIERQQHLISSSGMKEFTED